MGIDDLGGPGGGGGLGYVPDEVPVSTPQPSGVGGPTASSLTTTAPTPPPVAPESASGISGASHALFEPPTPPLPTGGSAVLTEAVTERATAALERARSSEGPPKSASFGSKLKAAGEVFLAKTKALFTTKEGLKKLASIGLGVAGLVMAVGTGGIGAIALAAGGLALSLARYYVLDDKLKQADPTTQKWVGALFIVATVVTTGVSAGLSFAAGAVGIADTMHALKGIGTGGVKTAYGMYKVNTDRQWVKDKPPEAPQATPSRESIAIDREEVLRTASSRDEMEAHVQREVSEMGEQFAQRRDALLAPAPLPASERSSSDRPPPIVGQLA